MLNSNALIFRGYSALSREGTPQVWYMTGMYSKRVNSQKVLLEILVMMIIMAGGMEQMGWTFLLYPLEGTMSIPQQHTMYSYISEAGVL